MAWAKSTVKGISYIAIEMEMFRVFGGCDDVQVLQGILVDCSLYECHDANVRTCDASEVSILDGESYHNMLRRGKQGLGKC